MKSVERVRTTNDFEEACDRYNHCGSPRWRPVWWNVICELWDTHTKWAKYYILDKVNKVVTKFKDVIKKKSFHVYWISLINYKKEIVFEKVGFSADPQTRWNNILNENYCKNNFIYDYVVHKVWELDEKDIALGLESALRAGLIKAYRGHHVPTDRFDCPINEQIVCEIADAYLAA